MLETLIVLIVLYWALRQLIVDGWSFVRGGSSTGRSSTRAAAGGRSGMRGYLAVRWSDEWDSAIDRHRARRARRAAGQPRWPRLARAGAALSATGGTVRTWWKGAGGGRQYRRRGDTVTEQQHETAWDRAWSRIERKRQARRQARAQAAGQDATAGRPGPSAGGSTTGSPQRAGNGADPNVNRGAGNGASPNRQVAPTITAPPWADKENTMAEAVSLTQSIAHAASYVAWCTKAVAETERTKAFVTRKAEIHSQAAASTDAWVASLAARGVTGAALAAARRAAEQQRAAATAMTAAAAALGKALAAEQAALAAWRKVHAELSADLRVQEAYRARQGAGNKEFVKN